MPRVAGYDYEPFGSTPHGGEVVSPSDDLSYVGVKGFIPNLSGTLAVTYADGSSCTMAVNGGSQYSGAITQVKSTGTVDVTSVTLQY